MIVKKKTLTHPHAKIVAIAIVEFEAPTTATDDDCLLWLLAPRLLSLCRTIKKMSTVSVVL
jgi:hypothetical protein